MAKRKSTAYMTAGEQIAGVIFFVIYLLVLPMVMGPIFQAAEHLLDVNIRPALEHLITYYLLVITGVVIFHGFLGRTCRYLTENFGGAMKYLGVGLIALYGLNELIFRLGRLFLHQGRNLNDQTISAQVNGAPMTTLLIVILLAPFVEELLFRGLVFGNLRRKSALVGYLASTLLFALSHTLGVILAGPTVGNLFLLLQYLVPGAVLCWVYEKTGTLWTAFALHAAANALAVFT